MTLIMQLIADAATQPSWVNDVSQIIRETIAALGGTAGIIAIIIAVRNSGRINTTDQTATAAAQSTQNIANRTEQIACKVNEVAKANPADVAPLPPPAAPLIVTTPTMPGPTPAAKSTTSTEGAPCADSPKSHSP